VYVIIRVFLIKFYDNMRLLVSFGMLSSCLYYAGLSRVLTWQRGKSSTTHL